MSKPRTKHNGNNKKRGVDALLMATAKSLPVGGTVRFRLVKGPVSQVTADPVDAKAPPQIFPAIAKFPESVVKPNFLTRPWKDGRLYQQDVPKPADDSDDEEALLAAAAANGSAPDGSGAAADGSAGNAMQPKPKKKRWKYNRQQAAARQWILQEQVDFLETMVARREGKSSNNTNGNNHNSLPQLSSRYEGVPEHNSSNYALVMAADFSSTSTSTSPVLQIRTVPAPHGTIPFAQPAARTSLSLSQAEQAIQDQRSGIRTTLLVRPDHNASQNNHQQQAPSNKPPGPLRLPRKQAPNTSKNRLLEKFKKKSATAADADIEEADDIMGDVGYRSKSRSGGGVSARRELLSSLGDGIAVSQEGVLGGTNDAAFGGRGDRFGQLNAAAAAGNKDKQSGGDGGDDGDDYNNRGGGDNDAAGQKSERGADGAAMEDDFYQRDVKAEYEELDYDANEQFDDDDVDLGESEVVVDSAGGFGDEDEDDELEELESEEEDVRGAEGLATAAGFKAMLAKARGESPAVPQGQQPPGAGGDNTGDNPNAAAPAGANPGGDNARKDKDHEDSKPQEDNMSKLLRATNRGAAAAAAAEPAVNRNAAAGEAQSTTDLTNDVDEHGLRIITLKSIRREIWLNHGSIPAKRLYKTFGIGKKASAARRSQFIGFVKELCTMEKDAVGNHILVLKQHYANMG